MSELIDVEKGSWVDNEYWHETRLLDDVKGKPSENQKEAVTNQIEAYSTGTR